MQDFSRSMRRAVPVLVVVVALLAAVPVAARPAERARDGRGERSVPAAMVDWLVETVRSVRGADGCMIDPNGCPQKPSPLVAGEPGGGGGGTSGGRGSEIDPNG